MSNSNLELNDLTKFRLDEINKIKDYLNAEIKERKDIDYADKVFITLSTSFETLSIDSYATIVGIPVGIAEVSATLIFTVTTTVVKTLLNITRKKKKTHNKIISLA